ncbi:hypothetical protein ABT332_13395 [Saccharomonospora azurea]|uniref:hypothetical protein n=1 Tax=Saccharomonospora azurea TaxID=40988 RepID=UPI0033196C66
MPLPDDNAEAGAATTRYERIRTAETERAVHALRAHRGLTIFQARAIVTVLAENGLIARDT